MVVRAREVLVSRVLLLHGAAAAGVAASVTLAPQGAALPLAGAVLAAHAAAIAWGVAHPASSLLCPVHSGSNDTTKVALTFDDGPSEHTATVLELLRGHGVKATFFVIGDNVRGHEETLTTLLREGHVIGSHSYAHSRLTNLLVGRRLHGEIARGIEAVAATVGVRPRLYRPPMGLKSPALARAARALDLVVVGWRARGRDGGQGARSAEQIVDRLSSARGGDILLLHDGFEPGRTGDRRPTLAALPLLIEALRSRGLSFVTVDQLLGERPYA